MSFVKIFLFTAGVASAAPAAAGVIVIGSSPARICYEAAERQTPPSFEDMHHCDTALVGGALSAHDEVATHVNRGILHLRRGDVAASLRDFDSAIALDPNQPEAYLNKGTALYKAGQSQAALPLFTVALEKKTQRPALAYYGRGVVHEDLGDVRAAYLDYRRATEADPKWTAPRRELTRFTVRRR